MSFEQKIENYIDIVLSLGINLKKGDNVNIAIPTKLDWFAEKLVKEAYNRGANDVLVDFKNSRISRATIDGKSMEGLSVVHPHQIARDTLIADNHYKLISVASPEPKVMEGVDSKKLQQQMSSYLEKCFKVKNNASSNLNSWCVIALANQEWADYATGGDIDKLWDMIFKATRVDKDNYLELWTTHIETLEKVANHMNGLQAEKLVFTNSLGTNLEVGLVKNHIWAAANDINRRLNETFVANMPTEEVFTMPAKYGINGTVVASKPLNFNGQIIDDFKIEFKNGKVFDFSAGKGYDALKGLIETDEGSSYLGEVALVSKHSPINQMNQLFFNTLFDENSSCHLALGNAYPTTIEGGVDMSEEEKEANGVNRSKMHEDFMFGNEDMKVVAHMSNGNTEVIMENGEFTIK